MWLLTRRNLFSRTLANLVSVCLYFDVFLTLVPYRVEGMFDVEEYGTGWIICYSDDILEVILYIWYKLCVFNVFYEFTVCCILCCLALRA